MMPTLSNEWLERIVFLFFLLIVVLWNNMMQINADNAIMIQKINKLSLPQL